MRNRLIAQPRGTGGRAWLFRSSVSRGTGKKLRTDRAVRSEAEPSEAFEARGLTD